MFENKAFTAAAAGGLMALLALAGCASSARERHQEGHGARPAAAPAAGQASGMAPEMQGMAAAEPVSPGQPAETLRPDPLDSPAPTSLEEAQRSAAMAEEMSGAGGHGGHDGHGGHGGGTYRHVDAGRGPGAHQGSEPQAPGAESQHPHQHDPAMPKPAEAAATVYACPMHPEVTSKTPGECPKCGMDLVERREE
jgi:hypothetical protein